MTLKEGDIVGVNDILENPKGLEFVQLDVAQIPRSLEDVTAGFVDTTYAVPAGLSAEEDGIYKAPVNDEYANLLAYRIEDKDNEKIKIFRTKIFILMIKIKDYRGIEKILIMLTYEAFKFKEIYCQNEVIYFFM